MFPRRRNLMEEFGFSFPSIFRDDPFFQDNFSFMDFNFPTNRNNFREETSSNTKIRELDEDENNMKNSKHSTKIEEIDSENQPIIETPDDEDDQEKTNKKKKKKKQKNFLTPHHSIFNSFGFGGINNFFSDEEENDIGENVTYYSSSSYFSSTGPGGHTVEHTKSIKRTGGIAETIESTRDSKKGIEKLSLERKLGSKSRKLIKQRDATGKEESEEILNEINPEESHKFDDEWRKVAENKFMDDNNIGIERIQPKYSNNNIPKLLSSTYNNNNNNNNNNNSLKSSKSKLLKKNNSSSTKVKSSTKNKL